MTPADPSLGAEPLDDEEGYEDDAPIYVEGDGPAPAASLTSIRLTRRHRGKERAAARQAAPAQAVAAGQRADPRPGARPQAAAPPAEAPAKAPHSGNIVDYWSRLRGGRAYPSPAELDGALIAETWPNAILLRRYEGESGLRAAALYKPEAERATHGGRLPDLTPMVLEWILSLAEGAVAYGTPVADKETFERPDGEVRYAACALPLSEDQTEVDHVLCYLKILR